MATFRPEIHIGRLDIQIAIYQCANELPTSRKTALRLAVEYVISVGINYINDEIEHGSDEWARAGEQVDKLFPELKEHKP